MKENEPKEKKSFLKRLFAKKWLVAIVIILLVGGGIWFFAIRPKKGDFDEATIKKGNVAEALILTGEVKATEHASLIFLSSGELKELYVKEGQEVKEGESLARLDTTVLYQNYEIADANLRAAQATVDRVYDDLKDKDETETYTEKETRTAAEAAKDVAYRNFVVAQKNLANASLKAPFDGIVAQITHPYTDLYVVGTEGQIEVVNPDTTYFEVTADQTEVGQIKIGQEVRVVLDAFLDKQLEGKVESIAYTPKAGEAGTVYTVKISFSTTDEELRNRLKIGMTGDASFILKEHQDVLWVPPEFVNSDTGGDYVNLGRSNNKTYIEVGVEGEDRVEIKGNISEGQSVYD